MKISQYGFTLVEVAAAVVVLGVMSVSVMTMYSFGARANLVAQQQLTLASLLQHKIEEMKCRPFATDVTETDKIVATFDDYRFDVVQTVPYLSNPDLKNISVTCRYSTVFGTSKIETVSFLVSNI